MPGTDACFAFGFWCILFSGFGRFSPRGVSKKAFEIAHVKSSKAIGFVIYNL
jgi:hypothetical protein